MGIILKGAGWLRELQAAHVTFVSSWGSRDVWLEQGKVGRSLKVCPWGVFLGSQPAGA